MIVKILGGVDLAAAFAFLMMIFGTEVFSAYLLFCTGLLFVKGMFVLGGDILSIVDVFSALILFFSLFFMMPIILLWIPAFLLLAKGVLSFL
jgi:hypothetical protein